MSDINNLELMNLYGGRLDLLYHILMIISKYSIEFIKRLNLGFNFFLFLENVIYKNYSFVQKSAKKCYFFI